MSYGDINSKTPFFDLWHCSRLCAIYWDFQDIVRILATLNYLRFSRHCTYIGNSLLFEIFQDIVRILATLYYLRFSKTLYVYSQLLTIWDFQAIVYILTTLYYLRFPRHCMYIGNS